MTTPREPSTNTAAAGDLGGAYLQIERLATENQQLRDRLALAEAKVQDLVAVATGAGSAVARLQERLALAEQALEQARLREDRLGAEIETLRQNVREGNARFDATVEAVVAEARPRCLCEALERIEGKTGPVSHDPRCALARLDETTPTIASGLRSGDSERLGPKVSP